jgi:hypothetical protein
MKPNSKTASTTMEDINTVTQNLRVLYGEMTFVLPLSPTERQQHKARHIGPRALRALDNRLTAAHQHRDLLPPAFDLRQFERDVAMTASLEECLSALGEIQQAVHDTFLVVGARAIDAGALAYGHIRVSAAGSEHLNRSVAKMASRSGRGPRQETTETAAPAASPTAVSPAGSPAATPTPAPASMPASAAETTSAPEPKKAA